MTDSLLKKIRRKGSHKKAISRMTRLRKKILQDELEAVLRHLDQKVRLTVPLSPLGIDLLPHYKRMRRYIEHNINQIPGPFSFEPLKWETNAYLTVLCLDSSQAAEVVAADKSLKAFFEKTAEPRAYALLTMTMRMRTVFGTQKSGEIVRRDVPRKSVSFEDVRFTLVSADLDVCRDKLRQRLAIDLIALAVEKLEQLSDWRRELKEQRESLALRMTRPAAASQQENPLDTIAGLQEQISTQITALDKQIDTRKARVDRFSQIMAAPWQYLHFKNRKLRLDDLNRVVTDPAATEPVHDIDLTDITLAESINWTCAWTTVERKALHPFRRTGDRTGS